LRRAHRTICIRLTRKGRQVAKQVFDEHGRWIASLFADLSVRERGLLDRLLRKVKARTLWQSGEPGVSS
jgi:DNA-binding MarR family transcriptional regulator